jgi:hypothetical protein
MIIRLTTMRAHDHKAHDHHAHVQPVAAVMITRIMTTPHAHGQDDCGMITSMTTATSMAPSMVTRAIQHDH